VVFIYILRTEMPIVINLATFYRSWNLSFLRRNKR